jgi:GH24 family phage-related lysozyme (muramidase)
MKLGEAGAKLMHQWEGYRTRVYLCPAHIHTIGYGHVLYQEQIRLPMVRKEGYTGMIRSEYPLKPEDNRVWTKEEIEKLFQDDVGPTERGVLRLAPALSGRQGAFDACVSFAFNAGVGAFQRSSIRMKINRGDWEGAADALLLYCMAGGKVLAGLKKRRDAEKALFLS